MFKEQVSIWIILADVLFGLATLMVILVALGLGLIDSGLSRRKNLLDQWIQKIVAGVMTSLGFIIVGYAMWQYQYNQALGVAHPFRQALSDWWLGGTNLTNFAQMLDPKVVYEADVLQIFAGFFITFAFILGVFLQSTGSERLKPIPLYVMCFVVGAVPWPVLSYLVWGSVSPLTNRGLHDFTGVFNLYLFVGGWSVVMAKRLGPRLGAFVADHRTTGPQPHNMAHVAVGVLLMMFALPFVVLGSGFIVPDGGYFGISMTTSSFGIVFLNVLMAFLGGGLSGALLSYRLRDPIWALLGPIAGYVSGSALFDVAKPWQTLLVSFFGPGVVYGTYRLLRTWGIDDPKIGPLTLGGGVYGAIVVGFVAWGTKTGGFFGLTGKYAFQHATINPGWQVVGVVVSVGFGAVSCLVLTEICRRTIGLRIDEDDEIRGLDKTYWPGQGEALIAEATVPAPPGAGG